ncbi:MAG TPA: ABC transporter permease [Candidatus Aquilonibacter sp.]|nr:ABC transporter permease [Candidatus Aquilonibacter sp.]
MRRALRYVIFYGLLFGLWALLAELRIWPPYLFPTPWGVGEALRAGFADHSFWIAIVVSMRRMLLGYGISVTLGVALGLGVASSKFLEETVGGLLVSLQSLPSICWWPLALLWFGLSQNAILFVIVMGSMLSVTLAMEDGRKQMPRIFGMAGRNLGAHGFKLFWYVLLPASLPFIVSGLKQGWAFAWRSLIGAEMLYLSLGLGQILMMGRDLNDMNAVIAVMILIVAIGYVTNGVVFRSVERRLQRKWGVAT